MLIARRRTGRAAAGRRQSRMDPSDQTLRFAIVGPIAREDLPGLYERMCRTLEYSRGRPIRCEVSGVRADAVAVDALARLQLAARRNGCRVTLEGMSGELSELVGLMGLRDVLAG